MEVNWSDIDVKERKKVFRQIAAEKNMSREDKTKLLKNMYEGLECVCLTTGGSLSEFTKEKIEEMYGEIPVFSVKMAAIKYAKITDICVTNFYNTFDFEGVLPFLFLARNEAPIDHPNQVNLNLINPKTHVTEFKGEVDILWGCDNRCLHSNSVCNANRWEENTLDKQPTNRILGPGILNDMAIPVMMHTGVSKIKIIGWDGSVLDEKGSVEHFYDIEEQFRPVANCMRRNLDLSTIKADLKEDEQQVVRKAELDIKNFLNNNGIEIEILTKLSHVDKAIKRNLELYG